MIENTGKTDRILVAMSDRPHDPEAPDSVPQLLIATQRGGAL
jgi:hypothetical protein